MIWCFEFLRFVRRFDPSDKPRDLRWSPERTPCELSLSLWLHLQSTTIMSFILRQQNLARPLSRRLNIKPKTTFLKSSKPIALKKFSMINLPMTCLPLIKASKPQTTAMSSSGKTYLASIASLLWLRYSCSTTTYRHSKHTSRDVTPVSWQQAGRIVLGFRFLGIYCYIFVVCLLLLVQ